MTSPRSRSRRDQPQITEAVILLAGSGSRLRAVRENILKPLIPINGQPLVSYTMEAFATAGVEKIFAIVGFESESIIRGIKPLIPRGIEIQFVENREWQKQNGLSLLAAAPHVKARFLLTMGDHLFDRSIVDLLLRNADLDRVNLAVDKKLDSIFDLSDAMKVRAAGTRLIAIGKNMSDFNAIDTGVFLCTKEIFDYLERANRGGDCSLADGIQLMAEDDKVRVHDIGAAWWQDVDTAEMLEHAEATTKLRRVAAGSPHHAAFR
jgi:1L-myo-inositol 1-phosphate cytidylyltransferase